MSTIEQLEGAIEAAVIDIDRGVVTATRSKTGRVAPDARDVAGALSALAKSAADAQARVAGLAQWGGQGTLGGVFQEMHLISGGQQRFAKAASGGRLMVVLVTDRHTKAGLGSAHVGALAARAEPSTTGEEVPSCS